MESDKYGTSFESVENTLIAKYNLFAGNNAKFEKIFIKDNASSAVKVGSITEGLLSNDVSMGVTINFENSKASISNVKNIWEKDGVLFLETETSVYKLVRERSPAEGEKFEFSDVYSVVTAKGSEYKYLPDGTTQRYKLAENRLSEPKSVLVFIPDYTSVKNSLPKNSLDLLGNDESAYEATMLGYIHDADLLVQIVNRAGKIMRTNKDIIEDGGPVYIAFGSKAKIDFYIPVSHLPRIGYSTYDMNINKDGIWKRRHFGNKVTKILLKK